MNITSLTRLSHRPSPQWHPARSGHRHHLLELRTLLGTPHSHRIAHVQFHRCRAHPVPLIERSRGTQYSIIAMHIETLYRICDADRLRDPGDGHLPRALGGASRPHLVGVSKRSTTSKKSTPCTSGGSNTGEYVPSRRDAQPVTSPAWRAPWVSQAWTATIATRSAGSPSRSSACRYGMG